MGSLLVPSIPRRLSDLRSFKTKRGKDGFPLKLTAPNVVEMNGSQVSLILKAML